MISPSLSVSAVVVSVLLFGAKEPWAFAASGLAAVLAFNFAFRESSDLPARRSFFGQKRFFLPVSGLFVLFVIQVVPLPGALVGFLSPDTHEFQKLVSEKGYYSLSVSAFDTVNGAVFFLVYVFVFCAAFLCGKSGFARKMAVFLVVFGAAVSFFALIQDSTSEGKIYWLREVGEGGIPFGPFRNRNHFAGFVGMLIPVGMGLALGERPAGKSLLFAFLSLLMTVSLFYSLSRGGIAGFLVSTGSFFLLSRRGMKRGGMVFFGLFFSALAVYLVFLGVSPFVERFSLDGFSLGSRLLVWKGALDAFRAAPLLGTGLGTFGFVFPLYQPDGLPGFFDYAHNDYLQFLLETGVLGGALAVWLSAALGAGLAESHRRAKRSFLSAGFVSSVIYMLFHSLFDFNLHMPSNAMAFSLLLGLALSGMPGKRHESK